MTTRRRTGFGGTLVLALLAMLSGMALQCGSDPAIVGDGGLVDGLLADLGLRDSGPAADSKAGRDAARDSRSTADGLLADGIGPTADAATDGGAPSEWFTMVYKRDGLTTADTLIAPASNGGVDTRLYFDGTQLKQGIYAMYMIVNDETRGSELRFRAQFDPIFAATTVAASSITGGNIGEADRRLGQSGFRYLCSVTDSACQVSGSITFTTVSTTTVSGSYSLQFTHDPDGTRDLNGTFSYLLPEVSAGEWQP